MYSVESAEQQKFQSIICFLHISLMLQKYDSQEILCNDHTA